MAKINFLAFQAAMAAETWTAKNVFKAYKLFHKKNGSISIEEYYHYLQLLDKECPFIYVGATADDVVTAIDQAVEAIVTSQYA